MASENLDTLRETVLETMRNSSFYTDTPGITYENPDVLEYVYSDCGGGTLSVKLVGEHVTTEPLSGDWGGLPETDDDDSAQDLRLYGLLMDPRRVLPCLVDLVLEKEGDRRVLAGRVAIERLPGGDVSLPRDDNPEWAAHLSDDEVIKLFSPKVRLVLNEQNQVLSMQVTSADPLQEGEVDDLGTLNFLYR